MWRSVSDRLLAEDLIMCHPRSLLLGFATTRDLRASSTFAALGSDPEEVLRQMQGLVFWAWALTMALYVA